VIELALEATVAAEPIEARIRKAVKEGRVGAGNPAAMAVHAREAGVITAEEHALLQRRAMLRDRAIAVDDFPQDFAHEAGVQPPLPSTLREAA
jgi:acyl-CoA dehydrogenase